MNTATIVPEGYQLPLGKENLTVFSARVDEHYFSTIGIPVMHGCGFHEQGAIDTPRVAVVNDAAATHYWPNQDPVVTRFQLFERGTSTWVEVIGAARMSKYLWLGEGPTDFVCLPYRQDFQSEMVLLTASVGDPAALVTPLRQLVQTFDRRQPIFKVRTMEEFYQMRTITIFNTIIGTIGAMGSIGLAVAIVDLYGLVAYSVSRRTREIGVRMAIGAGRPLVLQMVARRGLRSRSSASPWA